MASACPLCRQRKGRRACPAKGTEICSHCCGTKRRVEIDCPPDCVYLTGAHAPSWEGRETERRRDLKRVAPRIHGLTDAQSRLFFLGLVGLTAMRAKHGDLEDRRVAEAAGALRKTVETRQRGVLYEHQAEDARAQGLIGELAGLFESKDEAGRPVSPADRDLLPVLVALEASVVETLKEGDAPTAFLDTATRLVGRLGVPASARPAPVIVEP